MSEASGLYKRLTYKKEATFGLLPDNAGGKALRRISADLSLAKDTYQSNEIRPEQQMKDFRHGVRRGQGRISGDLSAGTWADFLGSFCKRLFTAAPSATGLSLTIAGAGPVYTVTRGAGDWLAAGFKVGMVGRLAGAGLDPDNVGVNLFITDVTALALSVMTANGVALVAEGPIAASGFVGVGKATWLPTTGHVEESYAFEQFYPEVPTSERFTGGKINGFTLNLPPTGIATIDFELMAKDMQPGSAQYWAAPTAATETDSMAAVNGLLRAASGIQAVLTGLTITGAASYTGDPVVGSNTIPRFFPGIVRVTGQATAYFDSAALRDAFLNETEIDIIGLFTGSNANGAEFMSFVMPRVKLGSHTKSDGEGGIIVTMDFTALLNSAGGAGQATEKTTLLIQDSNA